MLRSDLCDYSDAYIVVTGEITVVKRVFTAADFVALNNNWAIVAAINIANTNNAIGGKLAFKNSAPFISSVSKTNNVLIDNVEDLDVVMSMYNLTEYIKNYSNTTGSLWNFYRDESNIGVNNGINHSIRD